jgi:bacilysin biosynthesis protein BacA
MELNDLQNEPFSNPISDTTSNELIKTIRLLSSFAKRNKQITIATLGPEGTSSDLCCSYFTKYILKTSVQCKLFESYEDAARTVMSGTSDLLLVANAYNKINEFYISCQLELSTFFVFDTADYGIAAKSPLIFKPNTLLEKKRYVLSTHPAPAHLIPKLMENHKVNYEIDFVTSTSQAVKLVSSSASDLCLTNSLAAAKEGLHMSANTYRIKMLWSIFKSTKKNDIPKFITPYMLTAKLKHPA